MKSFTLILGHARHGKDTFAGMVAAAYGPEFVLRSSSEFAAGRIIMPSVFGRQQGYRSAHEAFEDRVNHRAEWYQAITRYNAHDPVRLTRDIRESGASCYVGMRSGVEFDAAMRGEVFTHVVWVNRPDKPDEPADSFDLATRPRASIVNAVIASGAVFTSVSNESLDHLRHHAIRFATKLRKWEMVNAKSS